MSANSRADDDARRMVGDTSPRFSPISAEATARGVAEQLAEQRRVSTDPHWLEPDMPEGHASAPVAQPSFCSSMDDDVIAMGETRPGPVQRPPPPDGRRLRKIESRAEVLAACRGLMVAGIFRPTMVEICRAAGRSVRTGFQIFDTVEAIHVEAIADVPTRDAVLGWLIDSTLSAAEIDNVISAIIRGKV